MIAMSHSENVSDFVSSPAFAGLKDFPDCKTILHLRRNVLHRSPRRSTVRSSLRVSECMRHGLVYNDDILRFFRVLIVVFTASA